MLQARRRDAKSQPICERRCKIHGMAPSDLAKDNKGGQIAEPVINWQRFKLMNLGFGGRRGALQEIEVAALVGLAYVLGEHYAVAAAIARRRRRPDRLAARQFRIADMEVDAALVDIDLDLVAGLDEGEWTADEAFRRDMQDAGAIARPAHAAVGNAHHVAHAL